MEMINAANELLKCGMGKLPDRELPPLYLGEWIEATGHQQRAVAAKANVSQSYISNMSGGRRVNPGAAILRAIAAQIGVAMDDFYVEPPAENDVIGLRRISALARESLHVARAKLG